MKSSGDLFTEHGLKICYFARLFRVSEGVSLVAMFSLTVINQVLIQNIENFG